MENAVKSTAEAVIPIQPDIKCKTTNNEEKLLKWNPYSKSESALFFQFKTGDDPGALEIVPDNCLNFFFCCTQSPYALVSGIGLGWESRNLHPNTTYFGVKPYTVQGLKQHKIAWNEIVGQLIDFSDMFGNRAAIIDEIYEADSFEQRIQLFQKFSSRHLFDSDYIPDLVEYSQMIMSQTKGHIKVEHLYDKLGYTGRHCRREFKDKVGISIKCYNQILRFQNSVRMMEEGSISNSDIVYANQYYDQSHYIREFKRFASMTPSDFQRRYIHGINS